MTTNRSVGIPSCSEAAGGERTCRVVGNNVLWGARCVLLQYSVRRRLLFDPLSGTRQKNQSRASKCVFIRIV